MAGDQVHDQVCSLNWSDYMIVAPVSMSIDYYFCKEKDSSCASERQIITRGKNKGIVRLVNGKYTPRDCFNVPRPLKACVDGMIDAGILPDDSLEYIKEVHIRLFKISERNGDRSRVEVRLETIDG